MTPMDVAEWLRGLGLEQYAPAFRDNDIDEEVLRRLTGEDLRELGVTSVGHRRRVLDAISALGGALPNVAVTAASHNIPAQAEAERRQLTVMFCDLVGSTALSARFDPEDLREVIGAYHRCVADMVARFSGFVAKYMGDGVLIYFGYPEAHEDDAERAVRAGLAVIDAVGRLAAPEPLSVHLGIAGGLVVVGDLIGTGAAQERGVVGETPNFAARLQALAPPGTLVIAESTRRQIGARFEVRDLGPQSLKGFAEPQRAWRVLSENRAGDAAGRARRRTRPVAAALAAGEGRRRAGGAGLGGAGDRQIAPWRGAVAGHPGRSAHAAALFLFALPSGQRTLPVHRSARTRRAFRARRHGRTEARQVTGTPRAWCAGR